MAKFGAAFAAARKAGKKTFTWNGKSYTTKTKEDNAKASKAPAKSSKPKARPSASKATPNRGAQAARSGGTRKPRKAAAGKPVQGPKRPLRARIKAALGVTKRNATGSAGRRKR